MPRSVGWTTVSSYDDPLRPSLIARAKKRTVTNGKEENRWVVDGNPSLGDSYHEYNVVFHEGHYICDCHTHQHGEARQRKTCSHITAVVLFERDRKEGGEGKEPKGKGKNLTGSGIDSTEITGFLTGGVIVQEVSQFLDSAPPVGINTSGSETEQDGVAINAEALQLNQSTVSDPEVWTEHWTRDTQATPLSTPQSISVSPLDPPMPAKFVTWGEYQHEAVEAIVEGFESGFPVVMLDAPTGSGKTLLGESVRRRLGVKAIYTCTTLSLQDQVMRDFGDYAKVMKGRANYPTLDDPSLGLTADDCVPKKGKLPMCVNCPTWTSRSAWRTEGDGMGPTTYHCKMCHPFSLCPYSQAKLAAGRARLAVLNTAYFLAENTYVPTTPFRNWPLVILDEADKLEQELMGFVEVTIGPKTRKMLGIGLPKKKTVDEAWVEWLVEVVSPAIRAKGKELGQQGDLFGTGEIEVARAKRSLDRLLRNVQWLVSEPGNGDPTLDDPSFELITDTATTPILRSGWIMTGYEDKDDHQATVTFKPIKVDTIAPRMLWNKARRFLLMSASFVSPEQTAADMGLVDGQWTVVSVPSTFPPHRRPIFPVLATSVSRKTKDTAYPVLAKECAKILDRHPTERVLIHTHSYDLTNYLYNELIHTDHSPRIHAYFNRGDRAKVLQRYLDSPASVILAPSFDRGVDLKDDDCRIIVVAKMPYLYLGDKQVSSRFYGTGRSGKTWYSIQAIRTLCQMTGRGMRSTGDWCWSYILDAEFSRLYNENRRLFPKWWTEAIVWSDTDPKWKDVWEVAGMTR